MRVIQLIDSLEAGGAERIAVNYANALSAAIAYSGIVATRQEGVLKAALHDTTQYLFLNKKSTFDTAALMRLRAFVKTNRVGIVHAHGTSYFTAVLLKIIYPQIKIIWHEHYGARASQRSTANIVLILCSFFFAMVFVVNHQLEVWVRKRLAVRRVFYIPNFAIDDRIGTQPLTELKGLPGKRIVMLANLKDPKNHIVVLQAFKQLQLTTADWTLHLIGKDYNDPYAAGLKDFIIEHGLSDKVFIYGVHSDIQHILSQSDIGILSSLQEGFPVSLLEYGLAGLAVLSTDAGYCAEIIRNDETGLLFDPQNVEQISQHLRNLISDSRLRGRFGLSLQKLVHENYTMDTVLAMLLSKYRLISK